MTIHSLPSGAPRPTGWQGVFNRRRISLFLRDTEAGLVFLSLPVGLLAAMSVSVMSALARFLHRLVFGVGGDGHLSDAVIVDDFLLLTAPVVGGLILGVLVWLVQRRRKRQPVDPIEANALHGGRMSLTDSLLLAGENILSNGFGASVGLEAGYTQLSAGFASRIGSLFNLRRADLRILVGCGAAGAIAAAFHAPLTGAFYAFELIIGAYNIAALTPVVASALVSALLSESAQAGGFTLSLTTLPHNTLSDYAAAVVAGAICGLCAILLMQAIAFVEQFGRRSRLPQMLRPAFGGLAIGIMALVTPQVLSGGHGALALDLASELTPLALLLVFAMKALASAVSLGSGFRGGLFFASLFLGVLLGKLLFYALHALGYGGMEPAIFAIIGMSALAVSIIGGPLTMTFLALEVTHDFQVMALVLAAVVTASFLVRQLFGYSFATWRFHLRGESIRSAEDIGWIRALTVGALMRPDVHVVQRAITPTEFCERFPLGSVQRVALIDETDRYFGMVIVPDIHGALPEPDAQQRSLESYATCRDPVLTREMTARQALELFDAAACEALVVVNNTDERKIVGLLTESHALRRYNEELERRRQEQSSDPKRS